MRVSLVPLLLFAAPAYAEVTASGEGGFAARNVVTVKASPQEVYATLGKPFLWWNGAHSYSGDARNLTMSVSPGGCFCETVPADGSKIEHARVVLFKPNATLRLHGALGPLQAEGVTGSLSFDIKPVAGGGSEVTQTYVVGGFVRGGATKYAALVDQVVGEQLTRLKAHLDSR